MGLVQVVLTVMAGHSMELAAVAPVAVFTPAGHLVRILQEADKASCKVLPVGLVYQMTTAVSVVVAAAGTPAVTVAVAEDTPVADLQAALHTVAAEAAALLTQEQIR